MSKKSLPTYAIIIIIVLGSMVGKYGSPNYQLIFLGCVLIGAVYGTVNLKKNGQEKDKYFVYDLVSLIVSIIILIVVVIGVNYLNMNLDTALILIGVALTQLMVIMAVVSFKIAIRDDDIRKIRELIIGLTILAIFIVVCVIVVIITK
ncbi:hypothetical protein [Clostridium felsineum]|uniref:hypothetical protein n=1 Tax=Clostridium felsineum TaxID=36839 RepID=UPI00098C0D3D|nr:hypothetical protein [Clostridium felsineum]URZ04121.1 hypothetical protein CLAUR_042090 [Clostridium felsineum]